MSVKARAEKNFRRPSAKPGRKKTRRRWWSWRLARTLVSTVLVIYAGYRAFDLVVSAATLKVREISVHGNARVSAGEVQALVEGLRGTSILTADLEAYRRRLLKSPWISDAALRRVLPSRIDVFVRERLPMGLSRLGSQLYLVDRQGVVIDEFGPQYGEFDLPIVDGLVRASGGGAALDERRAELAGRVIDALAERKELARRVSQIDVGDLHDAVVMLDGDTAQLHLGEDRFVSRLQSYIDLAPTLRERVDQIDYVDLRFDDRIYVRPGAGEAAKRGPAAGR
ncbi:MAG: FtsQ-type POTRA domain-containing protein [Acidobacteriota bacterium]